MKVAIAGTNGAIGQVFLQYITQRNDVTSVVAITRKPDPSIDSSDIRIHNATIADFGALETVSDATWSVIEDADAIIWAIGTYDVNKAVNYTYPLAFQKALTQRLVDRRAQIGKRARTRFIFLGGAFTETDQSRHLYFLPDQRRMKGLLQTDALEFANQHNESIIVHVIRPGGILIGWNGLVTRLAECMFGANLAVRDEELGAFVADLAVNGSARNVIDNGEIVATGKNLLAKAISDMGRMNTK